MIKIFSSHPNLIHVCVSDVHGGKEIFIGCSADLSDAVSWVNRERRKQEREAQLRERNPALMDLWEGYQTMVKLVSDD